LIQLSGQGVYVLNKVFCVVTHTHWDREWYMPIEIFKLRLVDLLDRLIKTIEKYPEFIFHLDAQTVVLEDYLEIRPENRELLKRMITNGNIIVGPWYLQNDYYLTSGESTIRNLLEGKRISTEFGACGTVGYAPDQFGCISQLPQILTNFGVDNFVFGRGFSKFSKDRDGKVIKENTPSEFIWRGADGTEVIAIHLKFWYNNAQRFSQDIKKSKKLVDIIGDNFEDVATTPYLLLMNGVDHLEAQDDLLPILGKLGEVLREDEYIQQYSMSDYISSVKKYVCQNAVELSVYDGELRYGSDNELLKGTLSSRHYLKVQNTKAQNTLECQLEPLYSIMEIAGLKGIYSRDHFRALWKKLMHNHPHDSICGCSCDEVHKHMEDNFSRIFETTNELLKRGLKEAALHSEICKKNPDDYLIIAVNTLGCERNGVMKVELLFPENEHVEGFKIYDINENIIEYSLISKKNELYDLFSPVNLPGVMRVDLFEIYLYAEDVNRMSVKGFVIKKSNEIKPILKTKKDSKSVLENEYLKIEISKSGSIDLTDLTSGRIMKNCLYFEETVDRGDSYIYFKTDDPAILSTSFEPHINITEKNQYVSSCNIEWTLNLPENYDFGKHCRTEKKAKNKVSLTLTLEKGQKWVDVTYHIMNKSKYHRLRVVVSTDIESMSCKADIPFDIIKRNDHDHHPETMSKVFPNTSFVVLEEKEKSFAVFTQGAHECEHIDKNKLMFTVLRSTGVITRQADLCSGGGRAWDCPDNQCLREIEGKIGLMPYSGDISSANIPYFSLAFRNPLQSYFTSCDSRKFSGGRTTVQDSKIAELFYISDAYPKALIKDNEQAVNIKGEGIVMTAFKKSEDGQGLVLRVFNYSNKDTDVDICIGGSIYRTNMDEKSKEFLGKDKVVLKTKTKEIVTVFIKQNYA
jgi:alpha-mannosidase